MTAISPERLRQVFEEHADDPDRVAAVVEEVLEDPAAEEVYFVGDILVDLAELYSRAGRTDEAIATHERAMAAGYDAVPDPRMDLSRFLSRAGRAEEMRKIHEEVGAQDPDDVWFHNAAGLDELEVGDHERASRRFGDGIELCLSRNDPERVLDQLVELRATCLDALDRPPDELQRRGETFLTIRTYDGPLAIDPWGHRGPAGSTTAAVAWFPPEELARATERWPRLVERFGTDDYRAYARRLQGHLIDTQRALGKRPELAPITVEGLVEFASGRGFDASDPWTARAWAGEIADRGEALAWPPGRNDPCWCGSGSKYKRCCGTVAQRPEDRSAESPDGDPEQPSVYYELEVTLVGARPPVWRRFQLPSTATFFDLHWAIQIACGWEEAHLFRFEDGDGRRFATDPEREGFATGFGLGPGAGLGGRDAGPGAERLRLGAYFSAHDRCLYVYDFGDNWRHEVVLRRRVTPAEPFHRRLTGGERAFPPEDCGGMPGYRACVEAVTGGDGGDGEALEERREWLRDWDPEAFDLEEARARFDR